MPDEPEKPMEQALRTYAQQRVDALGAPLELHPATRQLLLDEVGRAQAKSATETPGLLRFLVSAWPRLAFAGAVFATLAFVLVLLDAGKRARSGDSVMSLAQQIEPIRSGAPATPPPAEVPAPEAKDSAPPMEAPVSSAPARSPATLAAQDAKADGQVMQQRKAEAPERRAIPAAKLSDQVQNSTLDTDATPRGLALADQGDKSSAEKARGGARTSPEAMKSKALRGAASAPSPAPASPVPQPLVPLAEMRAALEPASGNGAPLGPIFRQEDTRAKYRLNLNSPPVPAVLTSFRIQREGRVVRIIDADGSVYVGEVAPEPPLTHNAVDRGTGLKTTTGSASAGAPSKPTARALEIEKETPAQAIPADPQPVDSSPSPSFYFSVSGESLRLRQTVKFSGLLSTAPETSTTASLAEAEVGEARKRLATKMARVSGTNLTSAAGPHWVIEGQALVGGHNLIEIRARPATP